MTVLAALALVLATQSAAPAATPSPAPPPAAPVTAPAAVTPPTAEGVVAVVRQAPAFAADSGRADLQAFPAKRLPVPGVGDMGYFVEIQWKEKDGATQTGLASLSSGVLSAYGGTSCTNQFPRSLSSAGAATCASVNLAADISGTLGVGNGGTGITSLGAGVATWLGTPSSANLAAAVTGETGSGALVFNNAPTISDLAATGSMNIPNASAVTTDVVGEIALDDNAWAASRGAVQVYDGTANTLLVGALAADTPTNGQVPVWNTGGTVTWETLSGTGTVTNTGGNLTANAIVLGAGSADTKVSAGITSDGASKINLGVAGSTVGSIAFANATSGSITIQAVTGALGSAVLSLPAATDTLVARATSDALSNKTSITLANAGGVRTGTTAADTLLLQAYDVDGTAYTTFGTLTAGNTPTFNLAASTTVGGAPIASLTDPNADAILYWRDSDGTVQPVTIGAGVSLTSGTIASTLGTSVDLASEVTGDLPFANLTQGSALSVLGVTGNATADVASIAAGTDNQVLRRSGTALAFGAVNLASANAVTGTLGAGNGGTGVTSLGTGVATALGNATNGAGGLLVTDGTATLTNKTLDFEGTGNVVTLPLQKDFPAAGCNNATATSFWDLPTSSPAVAACRTGTNTQKGTLDFADGANLTAQSFFKLPTGWTGNIDAVVTWISSTTTGDVVWQIAIACAGDADADDPAFTDDVFTTDTTKGTANQYNDTASNTVTTTGTCAAGDIAHIRIRRDSAHASDSMAGTARLVNVQITYRAAL